MTEHERVEPFRYFTYMTVDCVVRKAAKKAIAKCREVIAGTHRSFAAADYGVEGMLKSIAAATKDVDRTLCTAEESLHRIGGGYPMDSWLSEQPEWLQYAVANEVREWVEKTFGE